MIDVKTLSIGNIVSGYDGACEIIGIEDKNIVWLQCLKTKNKAKKSSEYIYGIELTEDIIHQCGFTKTVCPILGETEYISKCGRYNINSYSNSIGKDWSIHMDNEDMQTIGCADVHYLHELQNVLKIIANEDILGIYM